MDAGTLPYLVERYPLLITKLYIPRLDTEILSRPHLVERLNQAAHRPLVVISAPAGWWNSTARTCVSHSKSVRNSCTRAWGWTLTPEQIAALVDRTEGWVGPAARRPCAARISSQQDCVDVDDSLLVLAQPKPLHLFCERGGGHAPAAAAVRGAGATDYSAKLLSAFGEQGGDFRMC